MVCPSARTYSLSNFSNILQQNNSDDNVLRKNPRHQFPLHNLVQFYKLLTKLFNLYLPCWWLMNCTDNGSTLPRQLFEKCNTWVTGCGVQTTCWLIKEHNRRVVDQLQCNCKPFPLTTWYYVGSSVTAPERVRSWLVGKFLGHNTYSVIPRVSKISATTRSFSACGILSPSFRLAATFMDSITVRCWKKMDVTS